MQVMLRAGKPARSRLARMLIENWRTI